MKKNHIILLVLAIAAAAYFLVFRKKTTDSPVDDMPANDTPVNLVPQKRVVPARVGRMPIPSGNVAGISWHGNRLKAVENYWGSGGAGSGCTFIEGTGSFAGQWGVACP